MQTALLCVSIFMLSFAVAQRANAQTFNQAAAGSYDWSTAGNWSGGVPNSTGATATFGGNTPVDKTITFGSNITVGTIFFTGTDRYTISSTSSLILDATSSGTAVLGLSSGAGNQTINANITVDATDNLQITNNNSSSTLTLAGVTLTTGKQILLDGTGKVVLNGDLQWGNAGGNATGTITSSNATPASLWVRGNVGRVGGGNLTLTIGGTALTTTFDGTVNLGTGNFTISNAGLTVLNGTGTFSTISMAGGATLRINNSSQSWTLLTSIGTSSLSLELGNGVTIGSTNTFTTGTGGADRFIRIASDAASNATATYNGRINISMGAATQGLHLVATNSGQTLWVGGTVTSSATGVLFKDGAGTVVLANTNGWTGTTSVTGGTLRLDGTSTLTSISLSGTSTLMLNAANTFTGNVIVVAAANSVIAGNGTLSAGLVSLSGSLQIRNPNVSFSGVSLTTTGGTLALGDGVTINSGATLTVVNSGTTKTLATIAGISNLSATYGGGVNIALNTVNNFQVNVADSGQTLTMAGTITGAGIAGITKTGSGTLVLTGTNNYTAGNITVSGGTLRVTGAGTLGTIVVGATGTFENTAAGTFSGLMLNNGYTVTLNNAASYGTLSLVDATYRLTTTDSLQGSGPLNFSGYALAGANGLFEIANGFTATKGMVVSVGGKLGVATDTANAQGTYAGNISLGSAIMTATTDAGQTLTISGIATGTGAISKGGAGALVLTGANSYSGSMTITGGSVSINTGGTYGAVTASTSSGLLVAASTTFTGSVTIRSGSTLTINAASRGTLIGGADANTYIEVNAPLTISTNFTVSTGNSTVRINSNNVVVEGFVGPGRSSTFQIADGVTFGLKADGSRTINYNDSGGGNKVWMPFGTNANATLANNFVPAGNAGDTTFFADTGQTLNITGTFSGAATSGLKKQGAGTLYIHSSSSYTAGLIYLENGTLRLAGSNTFGGLTTNVSGNTATLQLNTGTTNTFSSFTIVGGSVLRVAGSGTLSGGAATVTGTLQLDNPNAQWTNITLTTTGGTLALVDGFNSNATLIAGASGATKTLAALGTAATFSGVITNSATSGGLALAADTGGTLTVTGTISGTGILAKSGLGTAVLTNTANTFSGAVVVNSGTLRPTGTGALGTGAGGLTIGNFDPGVSGQTVTLDLGSTSQTFAGITIYGTTANNGYAANIVGTGTITLTGNVTVGGAARNISTATIAPNIQLTADRTFTITNSSNVSVGPELVVNGLVSGGFGINKTGDGQLLLNNAANNFTGGMTVSGGVLEASVLTNSGIASYFGAGNTFGVVGGTLSYTGSSVSINRTLFGATGTLANAGSGTLTWNGTVTGSGLTVVGGPIVFNGANSSLASLTVAPNASLSINAAGTYSAVAVQGGAGLNMVTGTYGSITVGAGGTATISGANNYTTGDIMGASGNSGVLNVNAAANFSGTVTLSGVDSILNINGNATFGGGVVMFNTGARVVFGDVSTGTGSTLTVSTNASVKTISMATTATSATWLGAVSFQDNNATTITNASGQTLTFAGTVSALTGAVAVTKDGAGTLALSGNGNNLSVGIGIVGGSLAVYGSGSLSSVTANTGTTFSSNGTGTIVATTINGGTAVINGSAHLGTVVLHTNSVVKLNDASANWTSFTLSNSGAVLEIANGLTATRAISVGALGTKTLSLAPGVGSAVGTFSGAISSAAAANGFNVAVGSTQTFTISGTLSGAGVGGLTKVGAGTLVITNPANTLTGTVTVAEGTLSLPINNVLSTAIVNVGNFNPAIAGTTTTLDIGSTTQGFAGLSFYGANAGNGVIARAVGTGTISLASNVTVNANSLNVGTATISTNLNTGAASRTFSVNNSSDLSVGPELVVDGKISGTGGMIVTGSGTTRFTATNNDFIGNATIGGGSSTLVPTLEVTKLANTGVASSLGTGDTITLSFGTLAYIGAGGDTTNRLIQLAPDDNTNSIFNNSAGTTISFTGNLNLVGGNVDMLVTGGAGNIYYGGTIGTGSSASWEMTRFVKQGAGTVTVTNKGSEWSNTWTISEGTVNVSSSSAMTFALLQMLETATDATLNANSDMTWTTVNLGPRALITGTSSATLTITTLSYAGTTGSQTAEINGVTLRTTTIDVANNPDAAIDLRIASNIHTSSSILKRGEGVLEMTGTMLGSSVVTMSNGTLRLNYGTNATSKLPDAAALILGPGSGTIDNVVELIGNASTPYTELLGTLSLATAGQTTLRVQGLNSGATLTLAVGAFTRSAGNITFDPNADGVITVSSGLSNTNGIIGSWARYGNGNNWATVGTGSLAGQILSFSGFTTQNNVSAWSNGHISNAGAGFSGTTSGSLTLGSLRFDAAADSLVNIANSSTLTLSTGGILVTSNVGAHSSIITGGSLAAGSGSDINIYNDSSGTVTIASQVTGSGGLGKNGAGLVVLAGNNSYTGPTSVNSGTLRLVGGNAIADTGAVQLAGGTILEAASGSERIGNLTLNNGIVSVLSGAGLMFTMPSNYTSGTLSVASGGTLTLDLTGTRTASGTFAITGDAGATLVKEGTGIFTTALSLSFAGTVVINNGEIRLESGGRMPNATDWIVNSGGMLDLFSVGATSLDKINGNVYLAGGTLTHWGGDNATSEVISKLTLSQGGNNFNIAIDTNLSVTFTATQFERTNSATLAVRGFNLGLVSATTSRIVFTGGISDPLVGAASGDGMQILPWAVGSTSATKPTTISTFVQVTDFLTYGATGFRTLTTGEFVTNSFGGGGSNVRLTTTASGITDQTINSLVIDTGAGAVSVSGTGSSTLTINSGGILFTSTTAANAATLGGFASITPGSTYSQHFAHVWINTATISSLLANASTGTADLIKAGSGTLVLTAANTFAGNVYVNDGTLQLSGGTNRLPSTSALTLSAGTTFSRLDLAGNNQQLAGIYATHSLASIINTGGGTPTLTVSVGTGINDTYSAILAANSFNLVKNGAGALYLTGASTLHTGETTISAGLLAINGNWAGTSLVHVAGGTFSGNGTISRSISLSGGTISLASTGVLAHAGGLTSTGTSTWSGLGSVVGAVTVSSGALNVTSGATLSTSGINVAGSLDVAGTVTGSATITGAVNGAGSIYGNSTLSGGTISFGSGGQIAGTLHTTGGNWTGAGAVTGAITQTAGTFEVSSGATLNNAGGFTLDAGQFTANGTINGNVTVNNGTLAGSGTIDGLVTIDDGILSPGNSPGLLTMSELDMNGGDYLWQLAALTTAGAGTNFDFVLVDDGNANLSDTANVVLDFSLLPTLDQPSPDNSFWLTDQQWTILSVTGGGVVSGTFGDLNQIVDLGVFGSGIFSLQYDATNVYLNYAVAAIPEPGSLLLASLGALTLGGLGYRRRKARAPAALSTEAQA